LYSHYSGSADLQVAYETITLRPLSAEHYRHGCCADTTSTLSSLCYKADQTLFDNITSCARSDTVCLHPMQVDNIFVFIRQVAAIPASWLFKTSATSWPFDLEIGVRITCDVGHLCDNFSLPRPLCSRLRPVVRDSQISDVRQTDVRQTSDKSIA